LLSERQLREIQLDQERALRAQVDKVPTIMNLLFDVDCLARSVSNESKSSKLRGLFLFLRGCFMAVYIIFSLLFEYIAPVQFLFLFRQKRDALELAMKTNESKLLAQQESLTAEFERQRLVHCAN
jgi:predicted membrane protein